MSFSLTLLWILAPPAGQSPKAQEAQKAQEKDVRFTGEDGFVLTGGGLGSQLR